MKWLIMICVIAYEADAFEVGKVFVGPGFFLGGDMVNTLGYLSTDVKVEIKKIKYFPDDYLIQIGTYRFGRLKLNINGAFCYNMKLFKSSVLKPYISYGITGMPLWGFIGAGVKPRISERIIIHPHVSYSLFGLFGGVMVGYRVR